MKKAIAAIAVLLSVSAPSMAQEQQVYPYYPSLPPPTYAPAPPPSAQELYTDAHRNRIYPGREMYGDEFGPIPHHPGDYRDAVDRGQWTGGSSSHNRPQLFYGQ